VIASFRDVTYTYPNAPTPALADVSLDVSEGAFTLLAGPSAGGKSTLLRLFNGLVPQFHGGRLAGSLQVAGLDPSRTPARRMATIAGLVFQEPEAQAIADTVEDEVAFGMEQHGLPPAEMRRRIDDLLPALGIEHLRYRRLATLSGGERQRVAIAAVLALEPPLLLLDEPTSQLDPAGAEAVIAAVRRLHSARNLTVLLAEHRLERLLPVVDSVIEVQDARVTALSPREAAATLRAVPAVCELARRLDWSPIPLTVEEARQFLAVHPLEPRTPRVEPPPSPGSELLAVDALTLAYGEFVALREATFSLREGEVVALVGANGCGKSTLFRAIAGLIAPASGAVTFAGQLAPKSVQQRTAFAGLVPQDPAIALYHETVREEVAETLTHRQIGSQDSRSRIDGALSAWNLGPLQSRNPRDVSVGQQQRIAVAAMLAHEPRVWLLDEPTRGADAPAKEWLARRLRDHAAAGGAAIVATHDIESAARYATRVIALDAGRIVHDLPAHRAFSATGPFPTQVARLVPGALIPEDVAP
jgi:energy-coupling factor transport system ATP-binding protein